MKIKKLDHLSSIFNEYDAFIIDLWGVMHNGVSLNNSAVKAVSELQSNGKRIVFLSNAPRPTKKVVEFLKKMKMEDRFLKNIFTSGEAAINSLKKNQFGLKFYHLGPQRDDSLFSDIKINKTTLDKCDFILCTGLFDEESENLQFYNDLLKNFTKKKLVCTNPDLIVHRGAKEEYCAGTIAEIFKSLGGKVTYFGKPYEEVYNLCLEKNKKTFVIGDNLNTDIRGANNLNLDSLFVIDGVHRSEFKNEDELGELLKKYKVKTKYFQKSLIW